jgi:neutral ceramidase
MLNSDLTTSVSRRRFLKQSIAAGAFTGLATGPDVFALGFAKKKLLVGEGIVETPPPLDIELAGFHYQAGETPRYIKGIRAKSFARALVLKRGKQQVAIVSLDIAAVSAAMTKRVQAAVEAHTGIPAGNVRLCATHTHSMPTLAYWRQWGTVPEAYGADVEKKVVEAVTLALADCSEAVAHHGQSRAEGGNFNRTVKGSKTDTDFVLGESTDAERWLDTMVQVLYFERGEGKPKILWYNFASHPVCYNDGDAGPDWPALVTQRVEESLKITPSFLQGHAGDVNPGDGKKWIGEAEQSANAVYDAIVRALDSVQEIDVDVLRSESEWFEMPLDLALQQEWLDQYKTDPESCSRGVWVDAGFAKEWYEVSVKRVWETPSVAVPISAVQLGSIGLAFQPSELFSFYGLDVRYRSPFEHTMVTGYTDGSIGYVCDPSAFEKDNGGLYAAVTVPKIIDLPPFTRDAGQALAGGIGALLKGVA